MGSYYYYFVKPNWENPFERMIYQLPGVETISPKYRKSDGTDGQFFPKYINILQGTHKFFVIGIRILRKL